MAAQLSWCSSSPEAKRRSRFACAHRRVARPSSTWQPLSGRGVVEGEGELGVESLRGRSWSLRREQRAPMKAEAQRSA